MGILGSSPWKMKFGSANKIGFDVGVGTGVRVGNGVGVEIGVAAAQAVRIKASKRIKNFMNKSPLSTSILRHSTILKINARATICARI
jgi:hypothetical protein